MQLRRSEQNAANEHFLKECTQKYMTEKKRSLTKLCDAYTQLVGTEKPQELRLFSKLIVNFRHRLVEVDVFDCRCEYRRS